MEKARTDKRVGEILKFIKLVDYWWKWTREGWKKREERNGGVRWARIPLGVWVWCTIANKRGTHMGKAPSKLHQWPPKGREGGAPWRAKIVRDEALTRHEDDAQPAALSEWGRRCGNMASEEQEKTPKGLLGLSISGAAGKLHVGAFKTWELYREIQRKPPYMAMGEGEWRREEDPLLSFLRPPPWAA